MVGDRLSELPDSLLICIISFLGIKEAARTCLVSKIWQFLWTCLPRLEFKEESSDFKRVQKFVGCVTKTLVIYGGNNLEKFEVDFECHKRYASDVNVWLAFAVKNKVKNIAFKFHANKFDEYIKLPSTIYFNSYITMLSLRGCVMDRSRTVKWGALKILDLELVDLVDTHLPNYYQAVLCCITCLSNLSGVSMAWRLSLKVFVNLL